MQRRAAVRPQIGSRIAEQWRAAEQNSSWAADVQQVCSSSAGSRCQQQQKQQKMAKNLVKKLIKKQKIYSNRTSHVVPHHSTNRT